MRFHVQNLCLPKAGSSKEEYEDASSHEKKQGLLSLKQPRFAVADGATESAFSRRWARKLVSSNSRAALTAGNVSDRAGTLGVRWRTEVTREPLPWYAERKVQEGAFAAFVGLSFANGSAVGGTWRAFAIGDACLFQVSDDQLAASFPIEQASAFSYRPLLLSSVPERNAALWEGEGAVERSGRWLPGDRFLLMTDALALWFMCQYEQGARPWQTIQEICTPPGEAPRFGGWIAGLREQGTMRNDDVTLLHIEVKPTL